MHGFEDDTVYTLTTTDWVGTIETRFPSEETALQSLREIYSFSDAIPNQFLLEHARRAGIEASLTRSRESISYAEFVAPNSE